MIFKTCELYKLEKKYDEYGNLLDEWVNVCHIEIALTITKVSKVENGIVYHSHMVTGVTPFSCFELNDSYKIHDGVNEYIVNNITPSRFYLLELMRVVK